VQVDVYPNGVVEARSGSQDIGTGFRSLIRDCVAHELHIPGTAVTPLVGVSTYPPGPASGGSVTSRMVAPRALGAAQQARRAMIRRVADAWACAPEHVTISDGVFAGPGGKSLAWAAACRLITDDRITFSESTDDEFWRNPTGSDAVQFAEVTVDVETGIVRVAKIVAIQDVGQAVNRITSENQICGAVIQGMSFALFEDRILNRQTGAMVNPNMEMYKIAGPVDVPEIEPILWTSRDDAGVNSLGEPPVVPTAGAIGCAVANAIGVPIRRIPITPRVVLDAIGGRTES
jgi:xanthine dehydrogenase YagR molybdenum-binding subunit